MFVTSSSFPSDLRVKMRLSFWQFALAFRILKGGMILQVIGLEHRHLIYIDATLRTYKNGFDATIMSL